MKCTIDSAPLRAELLRMRVLEHARRRHPLEGCRFVRFEAGQGKLRVVFDGVDFCTTIELPADIEEEGTASVLAEDLVQILLVNGAAGDLSISSGPREVDIALERTRYTLALKPDAVLWQPPAEWKTTFLLPTVDLQRMIEQVRFAISREETRYYLNGICLHVAPGALTAVATDGHRLALARAALPDGADQLKSSIIPRQVVEGLALMLKGAGAALLVRSNDGVLFEIAWGSVTLSLKLIDGTFPDYPRVIPTKAPDTVVTLPAVRLIEAIRRVAIFSGENTLSVDISCGQAVVTYQGLEGRAAEPVEVELTGRDLKVGMSARYMIDALNQCRSGTVRIEMVDAQSPIRISAAETDALSPLFILMPRRI